MVKLTEKQKRFVQEYLVDLNATAAAKRAGYSEKSASRIAVELLNKTQVFCGIHIKKKPTNKGRFFCCCVYFILSSRMYAHRNS